MKAAYFFSTVATLLTLSSIVFSKEETQYDNIKKILPDSCIFSGEFTQSKKIAALPSPLLSSGKMFFSCQHGLIWHNEKPFPESLIYTSENVHFRKDENNNIEPLTSQQHYYLAKFLLNLLSAEIDSIKKDFAIEPAIENAIITLSPTNSLIKKGLDFIKIEKNEASLIIVIADKNQQTTHLNITNTAVHSKAKKSNVMPYCILSLKNNITCDILSKPQAYQIVDSNN